MPRETNALKSVARKARRSVTASEAALSWLDRCNSSSDPAQWFVYFLPLQDGSAFKVGFTCDPLPRFSTFSPRYFERFDLHRSLLLSVSSSDEARAIEARLKQTFCDSRSEAPNWVPLEAGGHTEWFMATCAESAEAQLRSFTSVGTATLIETHAYLQNQFAKVVQSFERWAFEQARLLMEDAESMQLGYAMSVSPQPLRNWFDAFRYFDFDLYVDDPQVREFVTKTIAMRAY